jgi:hypothetical protein
VVDDSGRSSPYVFSPRVALLAPTTQGVVWFLCIGLLIQNIPGAERFRFWSRPPPVPEDATAPQAPNSNATVSPKDVIRAPVLAPELQPSEPRNKPVPALRVTNEPTDGLVSPVPIDDPGQALISFYTALAETARRTPFAITRVTYYGDSIVASDYVSGTLRRALQSEFGDAGHGFILMADAWPSYSHNDVNLEFTNGYEMTRVVGPYMKDGLYGIGGVSFNAPSGVRSWFATAKNGEYGRRVSRFQLLYLEQPNGGELVINVDGKHNTTIRTNAPAIHSRVFDLKVPDGPHQFEVIASSGQTRTFGVVMEREVPGVVLDSLGIQGARLRSLDKLDDAHWAEQLRLRNPNLLVFHFGANESSDGFAYSMAEYHASMVAVLTQAKNAVPKASCLVMGAMDSGKKYDQAILTHPIIPHIVNEQRAVARELGCAFWNTFEAMGGHGSMAVWAKRGLAQADLIHPSGWGAQVLGTWLYAALTRGYHEYLRTLDPSLPAAPPLPTAISVPPPTNEIPPLRQRD